MFVRFYHGFCEFTNSFWLAWMGFCLARYFREVDLRRFCIFKCWFHWSVLCLSRFCFYGVFISVLLSFACDLTDKDENDITCYLIFSNRQILVQVLSGRQELSPSKRIECCLVFGWCILDCICVTGFNVSQARCFKLIRFSVSVFAVRCFVFAFGVVNALH